MQTYQTRTNKLTGTDYHEVYKKAESIYRPIKNRTKRRPYVKSKYFTKDKIFLGPFWQHLHLKNWRDRTRRLKFFPCAVELIRHTTFEPISKENPNNSSEILHRFGGITPDSELFFVQIKEDKRTGHKYLISVFPEEG